MKHAILIILFNLILLKVEAQKNLSLGIGIGNITKNIINYSLDNEWRHKSFDINLRYENRRNFIMYLEYGYFDNISESEANYSGWIYNGSSFNIETNHQPKIKLLLPTNVSKNNPNEIGLSLAYNHTNKTKIFSVNDAYGNQFSKKINNQYTAIGVGLTYHYTIGIKRFLLVLESELGQIVTTDVFDKTSYIYGFGLPLNYNGTYVNMDIELYYKLSKPIKKEQANSDGMDLRSKITLLKLIFKE